jgi:hypothetical protein
VRAWSATHLKCDYGRSLMRAVLSTSGRHRRVSTCCRAGACRIRVVSIEHAAPDGATAASAVRRSRADANERLGSHL